MIQAPLILVLLAVAWLTAGGMAVRSVSRIWLRHWAERRLQGGGAATIYLERPQRLLAAAGTGVAAILLVGGNTESQERNVRRLGTIPRRKGERSRGKALACVSCSFSP